MNRREFMQLSGSATAGAAMAEAVVTATAAAQPSPAQSRASKPARMKVGTQHGDSDAILRAMAGFGVTNICSRLPSAKMDDAWSVEGLTRPQGTRGVLRHQPRHGAAAPQLQRDLELREPCDHAWPSADRDRQIDDICQMIRNCARAGIPGVKYNLTFIGVPRTTPTVGRGKARYSTFVYAEGKQEPPLTEAGRIDTDTYWERITYFLDRVVPVANEYKVRMGCHPQDPGMPKGKGLARGSRPCSDRSTDSSVSSRSRRVRTTD